MKNIEKSFSNAKHQSFDSIQQSMTGVFHKINSASRNGYQNLLNANAWGEHYHKLSAEELFLMNLHNEEILGILNLAIYQSIAENDHRILMDGMFTYSRLRSLNLIYVGISDWIVVESLVTSDTELRDLIYPKSIPFNTDRVYDTILLLGRNLLTVILTTPAHRSPALEQYAQLIDEVSPKFDNAFLKYLLGIITHNSDICATSFKQMEKLYNNCKWQVNGWYRDAGLTKNLPVFLLGLYQLNKISNTNFEIEIRNELLKNANKFIGENPEFKPKIFKPFESELGFLNEVLTKNFTEFYTNFKTKMEEIKKKR